MKNFRMMLVLAGLVILALAMTMPACGSKSSDSGPTVTALTTTTQGKQAASTAGQGVAMGSGSGDMFSSLGNIGLSSLTAAPPIKFAGAPTKDAGLAKGAKLAATLAKSSALNKATSAVRHARALGASTTIPSTTVQCTVSGSITMSGSVDQAGSYNITMTAAQCKEGGSMIDGPIVLQGSITSLATGTSINITESLGTASNKLTLTEYSDTSYSNQISKFVAAVSLTMSGTEAKKVWTQLSIGANGDITITDYVNNMGTYSMNYTSFSITGSDTVATSGVETSVLTVDGGFTESWTDKSVTPNVAKSVSMTYSQLNFSDVYASTTASAYDETISGGFAIDFTPDNCYEGAYNFATVKPIHYNASGTTTAGEVTINTVVDVVFNASGTITVTMNGTQLYTGAQSGLDSVCPFDALN